jgi:hypothetical protein
VLSREKLSIVCPTLLNEINENQRITTERCRRWLPIANPSYQLPALIYHNAVGKNDAALLNQAVAIIPMK